jgi:hypothetical protein
MLDNNYKINVFVHVQQEVAEASNSKTIATIKLNTSMQEGSNVSGRGQGTAVEPSMRPKLPHLCLED